VRSRILTLSGSFLTRRSLEALPSRVHSTSGQIPYRVSSRPRSLPARRPSPSSLRVSVPFSDMSPNEPVWNTEDCHPLRRSAPRFSQPHSGFRNARTPWPCFMPQPLVGLPPFRAFPSQESRTPLGAASRLGYPPACKSAPSQVLSPTTSPDARAFGALAGLPRQLWGLIPPVAEAPNFPFPLDLGGRNPLRSANFTRFAALILLRVRSYPTKLP
jgi:hypothetical protein